jgi:ABC-type dipeptide/oligopeptide/nickel transport system permease component
MLWALTRRLWPLPPVLLAASIAVFLLPRLSGADTTRAVIRARTAEATPDAAAQARVARELGLDGSLVEQYLRWLGNAARGDFGLSFVTRTPVMDRIADALWVSATLAGVALALAAVIGIPVAVYAARRPGGWLDRSVAAVSVLGVAVPEFILAPVLILLFAVGLGMLPATGWGSPAEVLLPGATLAVYPIALAAQLTRAEMLDVLAKPHITLARSKGISEHRIIWRHAARLALTSVTSLSGMFFAGLISGAVIVEVIFAVPGMGRLLYEAVIGQDLPTIQAALLIVVAIAVVSSVLAEMLQLLADPVARSWRLGRRPW